MRRVQMWTRVGLLSVMSILILGASAAIAQVPDAPAVPIPPALAELPRDLSPWGMFVTADALVKAVLLGLVFASLVTWTVWLAKTTELVVAKRRLGKALKALASRRFLTDAARDLDHASSPVGEFVA